MKYVVMYLVVGMIATNAASNNMQIKCGRPLGHAGMLLMPVFFPIFTPLLFLGDPNCDGVSRN